jgi:hypothetical protein
MKIMYVLIVLNPLSSADPIDQIAPNSPSSIEALAPLPTYETLLDCQAAAWPLLLRTVPRDAPNWYELMGRNSANFRCLKIKVESLK